MHTSFRNIDQGLIIQLFIYIKMTIFNSILLKTFIISFNHTLICHNKTRYKTNQPVINKKMTRYLLQSSLNSRIKRLFNGFFILPIHLIYSFTICIHIVFFNSSIMQYKDMIRNILNSFIMCDHDDCIPESLINITD